MDIRFISWAGYQLAALEQIIEYEYIAYKDAALYADNAGALTIKGSDINSGKHMELIDTSTEYPLNIMSKEIVSEIVDFQELIPKIKLRN